jgi:hypothetical protein
MCANRLIPHALNDNPLGRAVTLVHGMLELLHLLDDAICARHESGDVVFLMQLLGDVPYHVRSPDAPENRHHSLGLYCEYLNLF